MRQIYLLLGTACSLMAGTVQNDLPPRLQWNANGGYCGETALISGGIYWGQYLSQYTARDIALQGAPQTSGALLIGINDGTAASGMRLNATEWDTDSEENTDDFLVWVKQQVVQGNPVCIGLYMNQSIFHPGSSHPGDDDYDHIVTVFQIDSNDMSGTAYDPNDVFHFSDHGLYKEDGEHRPYLFQLTFGEAQKSRAEANLLSSPIYSLSNDASNYGLTIQGVAGDTLPVRVETSVNSELPAMVSQSNTPPTAAPVTLTVTVSGLTPGVTYNLYRYNVMENVPTEQFNAQEARAVQKWVIVAEKSTYTTMETIESNEVAVYRAVEASAP